MTPKKIPTKPSALKAPRIARFGLEDQVDHARQIDLVEEKKEGVLVIRVADATARRIRSAGRRSFDSGSQPWSAVNKIVIVSKHDSNKILPSIRSCGKGTILPTTVSEGLTPGRVLKGFDEIRAFVQEIGPLRDSARHEGRSGFQALRSRNVITWSPIFPAAVQPFSGRWPN